MKLKDIVVAAQRTLEPSEYLGVENAMAMVNVTRPQMRTFMAFHDHAVEALRHYAEREYHSTTHPDAFIQCEAASVLAELEREVWVKP